MGNKIYNVYNVAEKGGTINSISNLNKDVHALDSHAGEENNSWLAENFRETYFCDADKVKSVRMKRLADGTYLMLYMGEADGEAGVVYRTSPDLKTWTDSKIVFKNEGRVTNNSPDAIVLENGTIIMATTRINLGCYPNENRAIYADADQFGIDIRMSYDNAKTWTDVQTIYAGIAWEPSFLEYKDPNTGEKELHCYYTNTPPMIHRYGYFNNVRSTGTAILRSYDNGKTWTPNITEENVPNKGEEGYDETHYDAPIVSQTFIGIQHDLPFFNDQMPITVQLHNGDILLVTECLKFDEVDEFMGRHYKTAVSISHDNWAKPLAIDEAGPEDKYYISHEKAGGHYNPLMGPYVEQFDSGEVVMTMHGSGPEGQPCALWNYIADSTGHNARFVLQPMANEITVRTWSSLTMLSQHCVATVSADHITSSHDLTSNLDRLRAWETKYEKAKQSNIEAVEKAGHGNRAILRNCYLNHRINAKKLTVSIDGLADDWAQATDALFVGGKSQAQAALRVAHDEENVYFLVERLDKHLSEIGDDTSVIFSLDGGKNKYTITASANGDVVADEKLGDVKAAITVIGNLSDDAEDEGYVFEAAIPKSALAIDGSGVMYVDVKLDNTDKGKVFDSDRMFANAPCGIENCGKVVLD